MIPRRRLGREGPEVGCLGYGAMGLEGYFGASDDAQAVATIRRALDAGMTLIDTADAYGEGHNEILVGRAIAGRRDEAFVASKFGIAFAPGERGTELATGFGFALPINGTPAYAARALDASLRRLGVEALDLWYLHYADPATPIEESVGAMAEAVRAGKVRRIGLSNVTPGQVRRAHAVHPIAAVQYEFSLWRREAERELLPALAELGIALVAWAPLGSGFLSGTVAALDEGDWRRSNPKYATGAFERNRDRFAPLVALARELGATPAQLALAWLLHRHVGIVPIPGTRKPERVDENARAATLALAPEILRRIDELAPAGWAEGGTLI